ncbi:MAG: Hpt domain-containing protein [Acidobacteriota bacterium]|nr:Hpt domain-containing protein [Acidobacteriota bacterium]
MSSSVPDTSLDRQWALSRVGDDLELLREIAVLFMDECPRALLEIQQAIAGEDAAKLENAAHSLKGSVANFGAPAALAAAFRLEQMGRARQLVEAPEALRALEQALSVVCAELAVL